MRVNKTLVGVGASLALLVLPLVVQRGAEAAPPSPAPGPAAPPAAGWARAAAAAAPAAPSGSAAAVQGAPPPPGAPPPGAAAVAPAMDGPTYAVRLRDLEQRIDELKEQIRRS